MKRLTYKGVLGCLFELSKWDKVELHRGNVVVLVTRLDLATVGAV